MPLTYKQAGVDIDAGDDLVERIKPLAASTRIAEVLGGVGGFAGLCLVPGDVDEPVLVGDATRPVAGGGISRERIRGSRTAVLRRSARR